MPEDKDWVEQTFDAAADAFERGDYVCAETLIREIIKADENNGEAWGMLSHLLSEKTDRFQEAITAAQKAVSLMPEDGYAWWSLGCAYFNDGQYELAKEPLEKAGNMLPNRSDPLIKLAMAMIRSGKELEESDEIKICDLFDEAVKREPYSADIWTAMGYCLIETGSPEMALFRAEQALRMNPESRTAKYLKAACLHVLKRLEEAKLLLEELAIEDLARGSKSERAITLTRLAEVLIDRREYENAIEVILCSIEIMPDYWKSHHLLGDTYFIMGQPEKATEELDKARSLCPASENLLPTSLALAEKMLASATSLTLPEGQLEGQVSIDQLLANGMGLDVLLGYYNLFLHQHPNNPTLLHSLGCIWNVAERLDKAEDYFGRAYELAPEKAPFAIAYGTCLVSLKKYATAQSILEKRLSETNPENYEGLQCRIRLADCYLHLGNPQKAIEITNTLDRDCKLFIFWQIRGEAFYGMYKYGEAEMAFRKASLSAKDSKEFSYVWNYLGMCLSHLGRQKEAIDAFLKAIEFEPQSWQAYANLGQAYLRDAEFDRARGSLQIATTLEPQCALAHKTVLDTMTPFQEHSLSPIFAIKTLASMYARAVQEKDRRLQEILDYQINQICTRPELGYIGHMYYTGHWQAAIEVLIAHCDLIQGPLLDIGCGIGGQAFSLSLLAEIGLLNLDSITGVDIDLAALAFAEQTILLLQGGAGTQFAFTYGDIASEKWQVPAPGKFKTVIGCYIWHWVEKNLEKVLENIANCLEPGGYLIVISEFPNHIMHSPFKQKAGLLSGKQGLPLSYIEKIARQFGLILEQKEEHKIVPTPNLKDRHEMFIAFLKKS